jgi:hypothetical protein
MPKVLRIGAFRFFCFSREGNEPPHIHVERGVEYAKYWLGPVSLAENRGFRNHELTRIRKMVEEHREEFIVAWNEHFRS